MPRFVSMPIRSISALGAVFFAVLGLAACGGIPGNAVVQVGDMNVTKPTFDHWMSVAAASSQQTAPGQTAPKPVVPDPPSYKACIAQLQATAPKPAAGQPAPTAAQFKAQCQTQYKTLHDQVLQFLISADWVTGESAAQKVSVTDAAVQRQFNTIKAQQFPKPTDFQTFLNQSGQTTADLLLRVKLDLLSTRLRDKVTQGSGTVTAAKISSFYNKNPSRFATPERRDLRIILTKTRAQAAAAKAQIQQGASFASVAKKVSTDRATKAQGGALLGVSRGQQEKALDNAVFAAKLGVLSGPLSTPFGFYVFKVQKITPATQQRLRRHGLQAVQGAQGHVVHRSPGHDGDRAPAAEHDVHRSVALAGAGRCPRHRSSRLSAASTSSPGACAPSAPGTVSRTSARSCPTPSRRRTSWPTPRTRVTTPSLWTSWATCSSRCTSSRCCSRSEAPATWRRWPTTAPRS
jgi:foldase protein PrsA